MVDNTSRDNAGKKKKIKKRKLESGSPLQAKNVKLDPSESVDKSQSPLENNDVPDVQDLKQSGLTFEGLPMEEIGLRYPVLKNEELIKKFLAVPLTNNQKGRIRQSLRDNLKGTSSLLLPDVIHNRILAILKSSSNHSDAELRKVRILYNMLKTALVEEKEGSEKKVLAKKLTEKKKKLKKSMKDSKEKKTENNQAQKVAEDSKAEKETEGNKAEKKEQQVQKAKGKKRYVVFLGNLPLSVNKEMIMQHFSEMNEHIIDIRIPKLNEEKKSAIAYVELRNEPTYELALSKHHSMMGSKRIKVLYTTQKNGKITKCEAKSKSAKLLALHKSGMLIGSTPLNRKRSQRRLKQKQARAREEKEHSI
ncbi:hypothetical protein evm_005635 [Chilo suppressalis]|nr:hypothetical protein evm_005635 [Chilo suppressalis]